MGGLLSKSSQAETASDRGKDHNVAGGGLGPVNSVVAAVSRANNFCVEVATVKIRQTAEIVRMLRLVINHMSDMPSFGVLGVLRHKANPYQGSPAAREVSAACCHNPLQINPAGRLGMQFSYATC